MSYACKHFGYDEDEGMRVFSIVEMFLSGHHIVTASYVFREMVENLYSDDKSQPLYSDEVKAFLLSIAILFTMTLVAQAVCGFLLYLIGWKHRHLIICYVWISLGCVNNLFSIVILITEAFANKAPILYWTRFFLYLLYVFYGTWVVIGFINWTKENKLAAGECNCLEKHRTTARVVNRSRARGGTGAASTTPSGHHNPRKSTTLEESSAPPGHKTTSDDVGAHVQVKEAHIKEPTASSRRASGASEAKSGISRASRRK